MSVVEHAPAVPALASAIVQTCTGINPAADLSANLQIYPNPSSGIFTVDMILPGTGTQVELFVYEMTGRQLYSRQLNGIYGKQTELIDLSGMSKGIYELAILIEGRRYVRKMIIR